MARPKVKKASNAKSQPAVTSKPSGNAPVVLQAEADDAANSSPSLLALQQKCLNVFRDALHYDADEDAKLLQEVKGHLFDRNFAAAFGNQEYLRVYASRWSPSRALGYLEIFSGLTEHLSSSTGTEAGASRDLLKLVCLGGGAGAELVALAGWQALKGPTSLASGVEARFVDIAAWGETVEALHRAVINPPTISKYASAAAKLANVPLLADHNLKVSFTQTDAIDPSSELAAGMVRDVDVVTIMFTLNELYSTSVPKTQALLTKLTQDLRPGAHLLIVDSPGSYSTVSINDAEKKYPMHWLLDHALLIQPSEPKWEKVRSDESRWFRTPEGLQYPIALENMRYQIHLYRKIARDTDS